MLLPALCAQHTRKHIDTSDVELLEAEELDVATHRLPGADRRHDDHIVGSRLSAPHSTPHSNTQRNTSAPLVLKTQLRKQYYANTTTPHDVREQHDAGAQPGAASRDVTLRMMM
jgi:hypothetical protein